MAEKYDIVLERDIGPSSAATTATTAAATATARSRAAATATAHSCATTTSTSVGGEACVSPRGLRVRHFAGLNITKGIAAPTCARLLSCARLLGAAACARLLSCTRLLGAACARLLSCTRLLGATACARLLSCTRLLGSTACSRTAAGAATIAKVGLPAAARLDHLLTAPATVIHPVLTSATNVVVSKLLLHVRVVVFDALTVFRFVLPIVSAGIDIDRPIDVDVVVSPIASTAPIISA
jgi:hypothetical protein